MKRKLAAVISVLCLTLCTLSGCFSPPELPGTDEVIRKVQEMTPEDIELAEQVDEDTYIFRSCVRDLEFQVDLVAGRVIIDGEAFGYDGSYRYHNNYEEAVYSRYMERVEKLIADHGLVVSGTSSDDMTYIKSFTIAAYNWLETPDIENINDLLYELREIAKEEQAFHEGHDYNFTFILEFYWIDKWNRDVQYIRTIGNDGYQNNIFADCPDEDLDIRKLGMTQDYYSNVIPPVYNGVLIYVDYEDEEDLPVQDGTDAPEDVSGGSTAPDDTTAPGGAAAPGSTDDTSGNASSVSG